MTALVVPSKHKHLFDRLVANVNKYDEFSFIDKYVITDGDEIKPPSDWKHIRGIQPFVFSRNVNLALKLIYDDVLLVNDDILFTYQDTVIDLIDVAYSDSSFGIVSPNHNNDTRFYGESGVEVSKDRLAFSCVFIKHQVLRHVGLLDETIGVDGYGWDDVDYCRRAVQKGYKLVNAKDIHVKHGYGNRLYSSSFDFDAIEMYRLGLNSSRQYYEKWGDNEYSFERKSND